MSFGKGQVVWEGGSREAPPYPDQSPGRVNWHSAEASLASRPQSVRSVEITVNSFS